MTNFIPKRVYFEPDALAYPLGQKLYSHFKSLNIPLFMTTSHNRVTGIPGATPAEVYREAKNTLAIGVRRSKEFESCKPSAHYQLPLVTSCPGKCEYCYLATNLGRKPYIRVYVNVDEILSLAQKYIKRRQPEITLFEGAATGDPLPVEKYTGSLKRAITFFASQKYAEFRFVTKFTSVDSLLDIEHRKHTHFRFSVNVPKIINAFEHGTPSLEDRLEAARKVSLAGYPTGIMIAPIFLEEGWEEDYMKLLKQIREKVPADNDLTFELITHRFTKRAKLNILDIYPHTHLPLKEDKRRFKFGQFGYGKYLYPQDVMDQARKFFEQHIKSMFDGANIKYFI